MTVLFVTLLFAIALALFRRSVGITLAILIVGATALGAYVIHDYLEHLPLDEKIAEEIVKLTNSSTDPNPATNPR